MTKKSEISASELVKKMGTNRSLYATAKAGYSSLEEDSPSSDPAMDVEGEKEVLTEEPEETVKLYTESIEPSPLAQCCTIFSLFAIIFLMFIATMVGNNSIYIKMKAPEGKHLSSLAGGVWGAVVMYMICFGLSAWSWFKAAKASHYFRRNAEVHTAADATIIASHKEAVLL